MGMYDTFELRDLQCPLCNRKIKDAQTKDFSRSLAYYKVGENIPESARAGPYYTTTPLDPKNCIFNLFACCDGGRTYEEKMELGHFHWAHDIRGEIKNGVYLGELHGRTH